MSSASCDLDQQIKFNNDHEVITVEDTSSKMNKELKKCDDEMIKDLQIENHQLKQDKQTLKCMLMKERNEHQKLKISSAASGKSNRKKIISLRREITSLKEAKMNSEINFESKIKKQKIIIDSLCSIDLTSDVVSTPPPKKHDVNEVTPVVSQKRKLSNEVSNNSNNHKENEKKKKQKSKSHELRRSKRRR